MQRAHALMDPNVGQMWALYTAEGRGFAGEVQGAPGTAEGEGFAGEERCRFSTGPLLHLTD